MVRVRKAKLDDLVFGVWSCIARRLDREKDIIRIWMPRHASIVSSDGSRCEYIHLEIATRNVAHLS
jgi:hypothetical protein